MATPTVVNFGPWTSDNTWFNPTTLPPTVAVRIQNAVTYSNVLSGVAVSPATSGVTFANLDNPTTIRKGVALDGTTNWWARTVDLIGTEKLLDTYIYYTGAVTTGGGTLNKSVRATDGKTDMRFGVVPPASNAMTMTNTAGGAMAQDSYQYILTFIDRFGHESPPSIATPTQVLTGGGNNSIALTNIPLGEQQVSGRRIYRLDTVTGGVFQFVTQINDNTTTSFTDTLINTSLGVPCPTIGYDQPPYATIIRSNAPQLRAPTFSNSSGASGLAGIITYVLTIVTEGVGGLPDRESNPSLPFGFNGNNTISTMVIAFPAAGTGYHYRIYRMDSVDGAASRKYRLVRITTSSDTSFTDTITTGTPAGNEVTYPPIDNNQLDFVVGMHQGMLFGAIGNRMFWSKQGNVLCWNMNVSWIDMPAIIEAASPQDAEMIVLTTNGITRILGDAEGNLYPQAVAVSDGCGYPYVAQTEHGLVYYTTSGELGLYNAGDTHIISRGGRTGFPKPGPLGYAHGLLYISQPTATAVGATPFDAIDPRATTIFDLRMITPRLLYMGGPLYGQQIPWREISEVFQSFWVAPDSTFYGVKVGDGGVTSAASVVTIIAANTAAETSGSGQVIVLKTGTFMGEDPERRKYFKRFSVDYDGIFTVNVYVDDVLVLTKALSNSGRITSTFRMPTKPGRRIYFYITSPAAQGNTQNIIYNIQLQYTQLGAP